MTQITVNIDVLERAIQALDTACAAEIHGRRLDDEDGRQVAAAHDELVAIVHEHTELQDDQA